MFIVETTSGKKNDVTIKRIQAVDFKKLLKKRYFFNWKSQRDFEIFKLSIRGNSEILGVMSIQVIPNEERVQIMLIANSRENQGNNKAFDRIAGNLIAYACRLSVKRFASDGAVSLIPKGAIIDHYVKRYGMVPMGKQLALMGHNLFELIKEYE